MTSDLALNELKSNDNRFGDDFDNDLNNEKLIENNINVNKDQDLNETQLSSTLLSPINSSSSQQLSSPKNESNLTQNSFNNLINNLNQSKTNEIISDKNINNLLNSNSGDKKVNSIVKRVHLDEQKLMSLNVNELRDHSTQQQVYIDWIESQLEQFNRDKCDLISLRESEEKLKQQQLEANRRENILVMRLATKEQEMQDYMSQIQELKQSQVPSNAQLQSTLVDPAVNLTFERMKKEVDSARVKVEEMQTELRAWKFTPDSTTGKRLMSKCRVLYQENEELGKMIASGRIAKLEGELALQKNFSEEMKKSQSELDEFLVELDEDVEGMQNTIYYLQQQLKEAKEKLAKLETNQQNDCVLNKNINNLENNKNKSILIQSNDRTFDSTEVNARTGNSDNDRENVANNGPNVDSINDNNETLDSVYSNDNEDYFVDHKTSHDNSTICDTDVSNQTSVNNNNYLSVNKTTNNLNNDCNNKRTSCFNDKDFDDQPNEKVAKLNDHSHHSNDVTRSESLNTMENNCIEINGLNP